MSLEEVWGRIEAFKKDLEELDVKVIVTGVDAGRKDPKELTLLQITFVLEDLEEEEAEP